jgi:hypothetical protein
MLWSFKSQVSQNDAKSTKSESPICRKFRLPSVVVGEFGILGKKAEWQVSLPVVDLGLVLPAGEGLSHIFIILLIDWRKQNDELHHQSWGEDPIV